ncbi:MAG: hypothetical protein KJ844_11385 [Candidatus Edwardsbacteria bacterium]|nr:hypothetical protein [Candidatus Edwardsbacteria bacterium]
MTRKAKKQPSQNAIVRRIIVRVIKKTGATLFEVAALFLETKYKGVRLIKKGEIRKIVARLLHEGELERQSNNCYKLTQFGIVRALPEIKRELSNDDKVRILVFDIPERERKRRDCFRRHIRMLGFNPHQKSVWISYENCEDWIEELVDYHKVGDYVSLYIGKHIW